MEDNPTSDENSSETPLQKAWIIPVLTERMGGGSPMVVHYLVGLEDEQEAIAAVKKVDELLPGSWIDGTGPVREATITQFGLARGQIIQL